MRKFKKHQRLEVFWNDIIVESEWLKFPEVGKPPDAQAKSLGYYIKTDKDFLYMSHSLMNDVGDKITIPLGCIKKIEKI